jgi:hypothetical protein
VSPSPGEELTERRAVAAGPSSPQRPAEFLPPSGSLAGAVRSARNPGSEGTHPAPGRPTRGAASRQPPPSETPRWAPAPAWSSVWR